jgi:glycosyltransferase involved in cell wall biosynthesis
MLKNEYLKQKGKVMMIGTELNSKGGIAAVVKGYFLSNIMTNQKIDYYPSHCDGKRLTKFIFYLKNLMIILLRIYKYKIVHVHMASKWSFRRLFGVITIAKLFNKKRIIHLHGAMFNIYYKKASSFEKFLIRYTFSDADCIIVLSNEWKQKLEPFCINEKIVIIPNTAALMQEKKYNEFILSNSPRIILFLGEIGYRKGIYDLIEALSYIKDLNKFKALICGEGEAQKVLDKIRKYGLEDKVELVGWVDGDEKKNLLQEAYLYILPSYHEGLPMSILEAMAAGTPVISTPVGGISDVVKEGINGFLVPPGSPQMIADRIKKVLDNTALWEKFSKNAYNTIKSKFTLEETEKRLYDLYKNLNSDNN